MSIITSTYLIRPQAGVTPADLSTTFDAFVEEANKLRNIYSGQDMEVLVGVETEHIHSEDLELLSSTIREHMKTGRIDFIVGSVHHADEHPIDFSKEKFEQALVSFEAKVIAEHEASDEIIPTSAGELRNEALSSLLESYFIAQGRMIEALRPQVIGHFSLPLLFTPSTLLSAHPKAHALALENIRSAVSYSALFELSAAPFRKGLEYGWPGDEVVKMIQQEGGFWCLSDDAHNHEQVALNYRRLRDWVRGLGIKAENLRYLGKGEDGILGKRPCKNVWEGPFWEQ